MSSRTMVQQCRELMRVHSWSGICGPNWHPERPAADDFRQSFQGLRVFKRTFLPHESVGPRESQGISWSALQPHSRTLEILHLDDVLHADDSWKADSHRNMVEFRRLCSSLTNLQQLAIRPLKVDHGSWGDLDGFVAFLRCLKDVKTLISLKLKLSLIPSDCMVMDTGSDADSSKVVQDLADLVFSELSGNCPRFSALLVTTDVNQDEEGNKVRGGLENWGFVKTVQYDENGRKMVTFDAVGLRDLKYYEPCSDIFEEYTDRTWHMEYALRSKSD